MYDILVFKGEGQAVSAAWLVYPQSPGWLLTEFCHQKTKMMQGRVKKNYSNKKFRTDKRHHFDSWVMSPAAFARSPFIAKKTPSNDSTRPTIAYWRYPKSFCNSVSSGLLQPFSTKIGYFFICDDGGSTLVEQPSCPPNMLYIHQTFLTNELRKSAAEDWWPKENKERQRITTKETNVEILIPVGLDETEAEAIRAPKCLSASQSTCSILDFTSLSEMNEVFHSKRRHHYASYWCFDVLRFESFAIYERDVRRIYSSFFLD